MRSQFLQLMLRPSVFSTVSNGLVALTMLAIANWSYVLDRFLFYEYFFGPDGLITASRSGTGSGLLNGTLENNLVIVAVAVVLGLLVYGGLQLWGQAKVNAAASWEIAQSQPRRYVLREFRRKLTIRLTVAAGWLLYTLFFIKSIVPFCVLATEVGIRPLFDQNLL